MISILTKYLQAFVHLIFPDLCLSCLENLPAKGHILCLYCCSHVSESDEYLSLENSFTMHFWGNSNIYTGSSLFYYNKGGRIQKAIHQLKYRNQRQVGVKLGRLFGEKLKLSEYYSSLDLILPIPLHPRKERKRGYNQSDHFAKGLSETLGIPWSRKYISRHRFTNTQTNKTRLERIENVESAFTVHHQNELNHKKILLVDDVLTTGATLEACVNQLKEIPGIRINCATIAMGSPI